jgi:hypothetical protein
MTSKAMKRKTVRELIRDGAGKRPPTALSMNFVASTSTVHSKPGTTTAQTGLLKPSDVDVLAPLRTSKSKPIGVNEGAPFETKRVRNEADDVEEKERRKKQTRERV